MEPFFQDYLERLQYLHQLIERAINAVPPEALDWSPGPEINSMVVLVVHTAGAERYWTSDVIAGVPTGRVRADEFHSAGYDAAALHALLAAALADVTQVVASLRVSQLAEPRTDPRDGRATTIGWVLAHVLEHTALHAGHVELMRSWWHTRAAA